MKLIEKGATIIKNICVYMSEAKMLNAIKMNGLLREMCGNRGVRMVKRMA